MNILGRYKNGNYMVTILRDGTKIRSNNLDCFIPEKPESMDVKITNCCDMGCPMCHEDSKPDGKHGSILDVPFFDTLNPYTEIAIGGGNPLSHPDLIPFLEQLKSKKLIPSMTVNQVHFMDNLDLIQELVDKELIYGIGISLLSPNGKFMSAVSRFPNAVIHVINGIVPLIHLQELAKKGFKILILGYKEFRRGDVLYASEHDIIESHKRTLYKNLPTIINDNWFEVVSFDNLAIKQLDPKRLMSDEKWNEFYMGDDGNFTMYIDLVNQEFAQSSVSTERHPIMDNIKDMFEKIKGE
jgi:hypothetical protein